MSNKLSEIDHIVVLMLENRSFDHMLGYLYDETNKPPRGQPFEGLCGDHKTKENKDTSGTEIKAFKIDPTDKYAFYMPGTDPGEGYHNTNQQLFGTLHLTPPLKSATNHGFVINFQGTLKYHKTTGHWHTKKGTDKKSIMGMYHKAMLPIQHKLASSYAVCDHWFCSAPTETLPNRAFVNMATSQGHLADNNKIYTAKTIYNLLDEKYTWAIYGYDSPPLSRASYTAITHMPGSHFGKFADFKAALAGKDFSKLRVS